MVNGSLPRGLCVNPHWLTAAFHGLNLPLKTRFLAQKCEKTDSQKSVKYVFAARINHNSAVRNRGCPTSLES